MSIYRDCVSCRFALMLLSAAVLGWSVAYADGVQSNKSEEAMTEAGVRAVEEHWTLAEGTGDTGFLEAMLAADYRSVNADGKAISKSTIVEHAARNKGSDKGMQEIEAYRKAHPYGEAVAMHQNTAIVTFYDPQLGAQNGVKSSDIFIYVDGHWHAMYSQHSAVKPLQQVSQSAASM
jgi:hypothetical protein